MHGESMNVIAEPARRHGTTGDGALLNATHDSGAVGRSSTCSGTTTGSLTRIEDTVHRRRQGSQPRLASQASVARDSGGRDQGADGQTQAQATRCAQALTALQATRKQPDEDSDIRRAIGGREGARISDVLGISAVALCGRQPHLRQLASTACPSGPRRLIGIR